MGKMLQRFVNDAYRDQPIAGLREKLALAAPSASAAERLQLGMMPMLLPDLVRSLEHVIVNAKDDHGARALAGGLLAYVYNPLDIIPDDDGPIGLLDDALICALGIRRLVEKGQFAHDDFTQGACDIAIALVPKLDPGLRDAIERFVADLVETTGRQVTLGVFPTMTTR